MISKELLSEVLSAKVEKFYIDGTVLKYYASVDLIIGISQSINIYELAHKCKEWAYNKGYVIFSSVQLNGWAVFIQTDKDGIIVSFEGIEHEAIFKACEWIRTNR